MYCIGLFTPSANHTNDLGRSPPATTADTLLYPFLKTSAELDLAPGPTTGPLDFSLHPSPSDRCALSQLKPSSRDRKAKHRNRRVAGDWGCADGSLTISTNLSYVATWACMFSELPVTKAIKTGLCFTICSISCTAFLHRLLPSPYVWGSANPSLRVVSFTYCVSLDGYKGI